MASLPVRRATAGWSRIPAASTTVSISFASQPARTRPSRPAAPAPTAAAACFSTSPSLAKRHRYKPRDNNPMRGVSSIRQTGPRQRLSVSNDPIPRPALTAAAAEARQAAAALAQPAIDPDHGLWQLFYDKQVAQTPVQDSEYGRPWTVEELRRKSWDDLHRLWWVCIKERNRIQTARAARNHFKLGFGDQEAGDRETAVRRTMMAIKHTLTERFYTWEDARELAKSDPEIDLSGNGPAFRPSAYLEEEPAPAPQAAEPQAAEPQTAAPTEPQAEPVPAR